MAKSVWQISYRLCNFSCYSLHRRCTSASCFATHICFSFNSESDFIAFISVARSVLMSGCSPCLWLFMRAHEKSQKIESTWGGFINSISGLIMAASCLICPALLNSSKKIDLVLLGVLGYTIAWLQESQTLFWVGSIISSCLWWPHVARM